MLFSKCRKGFLGSWWGKEIEIPVENTLKGGKYCHYNPNICYRFCFLWLIMEIILD
jgi:hypothetical protein